MAAHKDVHYAKPVTYHGRAETILIDVLTDHDRVVRFEISREVLRDLATLRNGMIAHAGREIRREIPET